MVFVPAAGLPWFVALFGRDTLIASLQTMIVYPEFAAATLDVLGQYQATERDDYRDAEPGKILHELRYGELAYFKMIPHTPYYGTADATPLYLIALHARVAGDRRPQTDRAASPNCRGLPDLDRQIRRSRRRRIPGIPDALDRRLREHGMEGFRRFSDVSRWHAGEGPKALCELQGYVYDAWLRVAEIYEELGNRRRANTLRMKAAGPVQEIQRGVLGRGNRLLRLCARWRKEKGAFGCIQCWAVSVVWHHRSRTRGGPS